MRSWLVAIALLAAACGDPHNNVGEDAGVTPDAPMVDAPPQGCTDNSACNDNDACTTDTCNANHQCDHTPKAIDDSIACTTDTCDPATGTVTHTPVNSVCEVDGKSCTVATCSPTTGCSETPTPSVCDDGASCSTDSCDPTANGADATTGCVHTLDNTMCTDAFSCTTNTCSPSAVAADPTTGCLVTPDNAACGDGINCTVDTCNPAGGADAAGCVHQTMDNLCEVDGKSCTVAVCSGTTGCSETPNDALCNDNASCTTDTCSPAGPGTTGCVFTPNDAACADNAECSDDACAPGTAGANPATGCVYTADPGVCSDNATCTNAFDCVCDTGFTGDGLSCSGVTCDALTAPTNGAVATSNSGLYPSTATYTCDAGFVSTRAMTRTCNTDGTWTGRAPTCVVPTFFVVRVGDGSGTLNSAAAAVFLEERDATTGAVIRTLSLPTAASGNNVALTLAGSATSEGGLSLSADGGYLTLAGYAAAPGTTGVAATPNLMTDATPINRVAALISPDGTIDTSTHLVNAFSGNNIRAACTVDGTAFWMTGSNGGVQYAAFGSTAAPTAISTTVTNLRHTHVFGNQLYVSSGSGTATRGVLAIGTGTPNTGSQVATQVAPFASTLSPYSFAVLDLNPAVTGVDTIYATNDNGSTAGKVNMQKWTYNGTAWTQVTAFAPTATGTVSTLGLAAWVDGATVHLVVSTTDGRVLSIIDDGVATTPAATVLATAATNTAFRGVARSPTP